MQNRAYSVLQVKSVDDATRVIKGMATTPSTDRMGDIVEPLGVSFATPLPLLWQHNSAQPVGLVEFDKPSAKGIGFTATIASIAEAGNLKDRVDEAWQSVKAGLVRAVSIGFRSLESEPIKNSFGVRFLKSEVMELSLVTIPANAEAVITTIKAIDQKYLPASGQEVHVVAPVTPGVTGTKSAASRGPVLLIPRKKS